MTALAEAFVVVKPDMDKFGPETKKKLAGIDASKEGEGVGKRFGVGFSKSLPFIGGRVTSFFKTGLGTAAAVAGGAVLGGGLIAGFNEALGQGAANAKFQAQLGLSEADSAKAGKIAGDLFKGNYGDSISGVNDAIKSVVQNTNVGLNSVDLKPVTAKVLDLAGTFDQDLGGVTRAVGQSIRTGLAKNATEALDFITAGFQAGDDKAEDFLDTLNEYGTQFRKLGIDGKTATGLISQGLKAGARDSDIVADAIKEFSIRAVDGSTTTAAGFKAVGLDAKKMAEQIGKGGKPASDGLQLVLDKLRGIKDPVKQSQAAIGLFGTQAEDLGKALFALDPSTAVKGLGDVAGAADKMDKTLGATPQAIITGFFRTLKQNATDTLGGVITAFATGETKSKGFQGVLQTVAVGARGIFDKLKLGVEGFKSAFSGEGVTSDGFVGALERIGVAARGAFDFFKTDVLPRLKEFGGFIQTSVVPALGQMAEFVGKNKDFFVPFVATILAIVGAMKAWAVVQAIVNTVMSANPIGIVVIAVAALVAGIIYAYKHSEKFREILQGAFHGIQAAAQVFAPLVKAAIDIVIGVFSLWWNYYAKPILVGFGKALTTAWGLAQKFGQIVAAGFNAIKGPAAAAIKFVVGKFLDFVQTMLSGAAKAFGWVPKLGPKLKDAATEFGKFRDQVNAKLSGIQDQQIDFTIKYSNTGVNLSTPSSVGRKATGGGIHGPGTGTSDTAGLYALSNGEHVWTAKEVDAAGGHGAMENMRKSVLAGIGYAKGGAVGFNANLVANASGLASSVKAVVVAAASSAAKALAKSGGGLAGTMAFGNSQVGKPYVWGAAGPNGYDCSGFVSALINYARGRNPYSRLGATGSMPWSDMASGTGRFMVGWFKGNPGHTAATINGVNFESAGGVGVRVGGAARGAYNSLFTNRAKVKGFAGGGKVEGGDAPFDLLDPRGKAYAGKNYLTELGIGSYAEGAWRILADHLALVHKDEMVVPAKAAEPLRKLLPAFGDATRRVREKLHQLHEAHVTHQAHAAHVTHLNHLGNVSHLGNVGYLPGRSRLESILNSRRPVSADTTPNGVTSGRMHPDDIRALAYAVADAVTTSPLQVNLDGRRLDTALSRAALGRG